jgi:hypothetical protein
MFGKRSCGGMHLPPPTSIVAVNRWERGGAVDVVAVAVRFDQVRDRFWRQLGDLGEQRLRGFDRGLGVDDDHALVADDDAGIAAAALDPVDLAFLHRVHDQRRGRRRLLCVRGPAQTASQQRSNAKRLDFHRRFIPHFAGP